MANLPQSVLDLVEMSPAEDVVLAILRQRLPDVQVNSLIAMQQTFPVVIVRRSDTWGLWMGDPRFVDQAVVNIEVFCEDPDGDEDAALLSEAVRVCMRDAWLDQTVIPGRGHITHMEVLSEPKRTPDWATGTGPVQYADLPSNVYRYETKYRLAIRRSLTN